MQPVTATAIEIKYYSGALMSADEFGTCKTFISANGVIRTTFERNMKYAVIADGYGHDTYRCPKCGEFYGRFFIHLGYPNGSFGVDYKCPKCKSVLERINCDFTQDYDMDVKNELLDTFPCPKCGKRNLYINTVTRILWD